MCHCKTSFIRCRRRRGGLYQLDRTWGTRSYKNGVTSTQAEESDIILAHLDYSSLDYVPHGRYLGGGRTPLKRFDDCGVGQRDSLEEELLHEP